MNFTIAALYHFFDFADYASLQRPVKAEMLRLGIKGTLLLTPEGINGTIAGTKEGIDAILAYLKSKVVREAFEYKLSYAQSPPFARTKVKLKRETISLGEPAPLEARGTYVAAQEWNALINDPETIVIDARNAYEVELGTFAGAVNPHTRHFKQLPGFMRTNFAEAKRRRIATFCTGGIRCEKFTAWLKGQGYEQVYHLKGGILKYMEDMPVSESKWRGECFVFDERIGVGHALEARGHGKPDLKVGVNLAK